MYELYQQGFSLSQVGEAFGLCRQAVHKALSKRGLVLRTQLRLPFIIWRGTKFTLRESGYYASTTGRRQYLHIAVWTHHRGKIPKGFDVHHRDENKQNNCIENLRLLSKSDHGKTHGFGGNQHTGSLGCRPVKRRL